ncbi:PREDICTED: cytochrome b-c1 complex subunit 8-like [Priapulus caudatus]|uniref:Cytochrome b-c1 complex subunit 8 n=1 Tax=Priapulus caudatus TaxID=37621 RepID=A0ABM1F8K3_PRICU|nr:PREDICTED: cytochrome b-c1 complex subunit 8-like [Priapulus caudatus]
MGLHFGELPTKVRGIIYYSLSPYEQRAYAGTLKKGIPNTFRRFRGSVLKVVPHMEEHSMWL